MKKVIPPAADTGGQTSAVVEREESALDKSDEELRRLAAARLVEQLDMGSGLIERCEHLAVLPKGDRLAPLYAAARLIRANALTAQAFANVGLVERRRRSIVEHVQPLRLKSADSNSTLEEKLSDELRLKMLRYIKMVADEKLDPALKEASDEADRIAEEEALAPDPGTTAS